MPETTTRRVDDIDEGMPESKGRSLIDSLVRHSLVIAALIVLLYPLGWLLYASLLPTEAIFSGGGTLADLTLANYTEGWNALAFPFSQYLLNSTVLALLAVVGNIVACTMAAYAFARLEFPFRKTLFAIMLGMIMLPIHVTLIPQYSLFTMLGLVDTIWPIVIPKFVAVDSFFIFLMVQFIRGLPTELDQAATVDGCGPIQVFWHIILPLLKPALATTATFTFIWTWNDFFVQLIYLSSPEKLTVPLAVRMFMDSTGASSWGPLFAMAVVSLVPLFLVFVFMQRYLVAGIATSGLK